MQFPNPITRLIRITYANGTTAIQIGPGPTAVFQAPNGSQIVIDANANPGLPTMFFWNANHDNAAYINLFGGGSEANLGINSGGYPSLRYPTLLFCQTTEVLATQSRSAVIGPHRQDSTAIYYGGRLNVGETFGRLELLSDTNVELARVGVRDLNSTGVARPITENTVGGSGMFVDATTVQIKANINEVTPIEWTASGRWFVLPGFDWTNLTLLNGWTAAATYYQPAVKMTPDGMVMFRGTMNAGIVVDNTQVFNLPGSGTNWCPSASVLMRPATSTGNANHRLLVNATGMAFIYGTAASAQLGLDGLQYSCVRPT